MNLPQQTVNTKAHYVVVTGIVHRNDKYLICKRSLQEKAFPGKWCVPGGKVEMEDFIHLPKDTSSHWLNVFERVLRKEILEETGLSIDQIGYVSNIAFIRPNGYSTIIISLYARYAGGTVTLQQEELTDFAWVSIDELDTYDLIENIREQILAVDRIVHGRAP